MPYNAELDSKLQQFALPYRMERKKMFGGTCFLKDRKMVCGVWKDFLILRLGEEGAKTAMQSGSAVPFDITGKPMKGWVMIPYEKLTGKALTSWVDQCIEYVDSL